jgi:hypothetical protein
LAIVRLAPRAFVGYTFPGVVAATMAGGINHDEQTARDSG